MRRRTLTDPTLATPTASLAALVLLVTMSACAPRPLLCARACDAPFTCASGECVPPEAIPAIEARTRLGEYQARRIVVAPTEVARLAPGDDHGEVLPTVVLGRAGDARAMLLLRFAVDLPAGTSIVEAHIVLDRTPAVDDDPSPVVLHAARIQDRWDARSISWGRAPRLDDARLPATTVDATRREVRIDVRPLVRGWREHSPDDQGIALVADNATPTGTAFALADGTVPSDQAIPPLPTHSTGAPGSAPTFVTSPGPEGMDAPADTSTRGPRLELYVKP
jgi:hypothetical protein